MAPSPRSQVTRLRDCSPLPPQNPRYRLTLSEFKKAQDNKPIKGAMNDFIHQKSILKLIEKVPYRWSKGSVRITDGGYTDVAHRYFSRTGHVIPSKDIAVFYFVTKNELLARLRTGISVMKLEPPQLESFLLASWPLYKYFRYYRGVTVQYEADLYADLPQLTPPLAPPQQTVEHNSLADFLKSFPARL